MVAAQDDRHRAGGEDGAHPGLDIGMALHRVGMDDVGIADIDDAHLVSLQIGDVILMVIGAGMAEENRVEASRMPRGPKRAPARNCVPKSRRAKDGEIGVDGAPVRLIVIFAEAAQPDEGKIQPPAFISMFAHRPAPPLARPATTTLAATPPS